MLAGWALLFVGCGSSDEYPIGEISGTISSEGKPLSEGRIVFTSDELGVHMAADITDGRYTVVTGRGKGLKVGTYRVAIVLPVPPPVDTGQPLPPSKEIPGIFPKYRDPATSGETATIVEGLNTIDIDMKP